MASKDLKGRLKKHEHRLKKHSITWEDLEQKCAHSHVVEIARDLSEWRTTRAYLGISEAEMKEIEANYKNDEAAMKVGLLETWLKKCGDEATYFKLFEALDSTNRVDLIDECLRLIEEEKNLKKQDEGVDSDSSDTLKDEDMRFLCGCGRCSLSSFLEKGCSNPWEHAHFPLLNVKKMKRRENLELLSQLRKDANKITEKFGSLTRKVYCSMKKLDVHELVLFLLPQQKFSYMSEEKRVKLQSDLTKAPNVGRVMTLLTESYISWFNHPLLGSITKEFKVCETEYQEYIDKELTPFLRRSLFEIPSKSFNDISGDPQGSGQFILKIDIPNPKDSLEANILLPLRDHVSSTLGIAIDAFEFCSYGKGCIQFVFAAPFGLLLKIFPLSDRVIQLLSTFSYKNLRMKSIEFEKVIQSLPKNEATNEECFLTSKLTDVFTMFASLIVELYKCIKENSIELQRVKEFLLHLNSQRLTASDDKPLFHNVVTQVEKISNLADLLLFLNQFWSFYNYKLLERLFKNLDINKAEARLKEYILFLEALRVVKMPPLIQPFFNGDSYHSDLLKLQLLPNSLQALSVEELLPIHLRVANVLGIEIYALLLKEIKIAEDKLEYLVPECFKFDSAIMALLPWSSLREEKIVGISFKSFNSDCTLQQLTNKDLKGDSEDSGLDTASVASFESENEDHREKKHTGGGKKRKSKKDHQSKGSRLVDSPPPSQPSHVPAQHHHVSYDTRLSPPHPYSASSFSRYDTNLYPSFACISPSFANFSSSLLHGNVNLSPPPFNTYLTYQDRETQPINTDMLLTNRSMESPANVDVHSGGQGSITFPPQVYQNVYNPETMPQFMSQDLLSQTNPQFVEQSVSPDFNYQKKMLPPSPPPGAAKPQNLLSPPGISQTLSSYQWDTPPASTVTTEDKQETLFKQQDEWPTITEFNVKRQAFSLNEQNVNQQARHSSPKNKLSLQRSIEQPSPIIQKRLAQQKMDYKGREMWKTNFAERLKYTELSEESVSVELTSSNYRDKFYYLLCFEESEHICLLSEKCDGDYKLFLKGYEMIEGRHYYVGYIHGMSHDQMQYATQASEAMFIVDREKNEDICQAEIIPANFGNVSNKFLIALPSSSIEHFMQTFGITEGQSCQVSVQFEVKHSYFDTLHKAVINIPQTMINKLFPTKEDLRKPLETAVCRINSICQVKALSIDGFGQLKALEVILQSPPNLPIIISGPFGSGKTRVLARATYEFVLHHQQCTRILICAHHYNTVETYVSNYLGPAFQGRRGIKIIKLMRNDSYGLASNIIHRSVRGFREDVRNGYVSDQVLVIVTTYTSSLHVANALGSYNFHFTHILLDEVAQVREPEAIGALCLGTPETKVVIAGDSKQVGPSVVVLGDLSRDNGLKMSLLERLEKRYDEIGPKALCYLIQLDINYRCHPVITALLSNVIYKYPITSGLSPSKQHPKAKNCPYIFYCSDTTDDPTLDSEEFMKIEADAVINQLEMFFSDRKWPKSWKDFALNDVCVMSSFRTQLNIIRKRLKVSTFHRVTLLPSYAIQGHEFQAIVLSTYEPLKDNGESSNPTKTLVNPHIFNTAISRSRQLVIAVGNPFRLLQTEKIMGYHAEGCWREYIKLCLEKNTMLFSPKSHVDLETLKNLLKVQVGINISSSPPQRSQTDVMSQAAKRPSLKTSWSYPSTERPSSQSGHGKKTKVQTVCVLEKESTTTSKLKKSVTAISNSPDQLEAFGQTSKQTVSSKSVCVHKKVSPTAPKLKKTVTPTSKPQLVQLKACRETSSEQPVTSKSVCVHEKESTSVPKLKQSATPIPNPPGITSIRHGQTSSEQPVSNKSVCVYKKESTSVPKLKQSVTPLPNPPGITSIQHGRTSSEQLVSSKSSTWSHSVQRVSHKSEMQPSSVHTLSSKSDSFQQPVSNKQSLQKSTQSTKSASLRPYPSDTTSVLQTASEQPVSSVSVPFVTGKSGSMSFSQQQVTRTQSPSKKSTQRPQSKMLVPPSSSSQVRTFADVVSAKSTQYDSQKLKQLEDEQPTHKYMKPKDEIEIFVGSSKSKRKKKQKNSQSKPIFTLESISSVLQPPGYSVSTSDEPPEKESPKEVRTFADVVKQAAPKKLATKRQ